MLNPADILLPLGQNISLFVVIVAAFCAVKHHLANFSPAATRVAEGMVFGLCAILAMMSPLPLVDGLFVDSRNIVIAVGSIMAEPIAGAVCAAMAALYRWQLGGIGVLPACVTMAVTLAQGTAFWLFYRARKRRPTPVELAILGTLVGISNVWASCCWATCSLGSTSSSRLPGPCCSSCRWARSSLAR